jgi:hypothetical protein
MCALVYTGSLRKRGKAGDGLLGDWRPMLNLRAFPRTCVTVRRITACRGILAAGAFLKNLVGSLASHSMLDALASGLCRPMTPIAVVTLNAY